MSGELTDYGFTWNAAEVIRITERDDGGVVLEVRGGKHRVQVYVSPTGRSVRVWKDHKEMK